MKTLLTPYEIDRALRYRRGQSLRLAIAGLLPHITLPDGEIRFDPNQIERLLLDDRSSRDEGNVHALSADGRRTGVT